MRAVILVMAALETKGVSLISDYEGRITEHCPHLYSAASTFGHLAGLSSADVCSTSPVLADPMHADRSHLLLQPCALSKLSPLFDLRRIYIVALSNSPYTECIPVIALGVKSLI